MWKPLDVAANKRPADEPRWEVGHWLGLTMKSDQAIIGTPSGVVKTRAENIRGVAPDERWAASDLWKVIGWPWKPSLIKDGDEIPTSIRPGRSGDEEEDGKKTTK